MYIGGVVWLGICIILSMTFVVGQPNNLQLTGLSDIVMVIISTISMLITIFIIRLAYENITEHKKKIIKQIPYLIIGVVNIYLVIGLKFRWDISWLVVLGIYQITVVIHFFQKQDLKDEENVQSR